MISRSRAVVIPESDCAFVHEARFHAYIQYAKRETQLGSFIVEERSELYTLSSIYSESTDKLALFSMSFN